jgi:hypothetical protein
MLLLEVLHHGIVELLLQPAVVLEQQVQEFLAVLEDQVLAQEQL